MTLLRRIASGIVVTGLLSLAMWLAAVEPHIEAGLLDPIPNHGAFGRVVANSVFSARVDHVDVARSLKRIDPLNPKNNSSLQSPGIFVIVYLRVTSAQKPVQLGHVRVTTRDGLHYAESGRTGVLTKNSETFSPLLWDQASYLFEIPKDQLAGLHLILGESQLLNQLSAEADIDLRIDKRTAAQLLAHPPDDYQFRKD